MLTHRRAADRGRTRLDWLDSRHTFSFGEYFDPAHMGFGVLRVINEDWIAPGGGFNTHPHRDMEILTWVAAGALRHEDSMGTGSIIRPGEVQRMSAGTGVLHSEHNASTEAPVHMLQIWILPERKGVAPGYDQRSFPEGALRDRLALVASRDGREGSVSMNQDVDLRAASLAPGAAVSHRLRPGRRAWAQVVSGEVTLETSGGEARGGDGGGGTALLEAGDGASVDEAEGLTLRAATRAELLLFDLP